MEYLVARKTDIGTTRSVNQDNGYVVVADTMVGQICLAAIADGMGGLQQGEIASRMMVEGLKEWFGQTFGSFINRYERMLSFDEFNREMSELCSRISKQIMKKLGVSGTTVTILLLHEGRYYICNVGDSRIYSYKEGKVQLMTVDQTVVQWALDRGEITQEEADQRTDKNVLIQCIGANETISPDYREGKFKPGDIFLLCSDGFSHEITNKDMEKAFGQMASETAMEKYCTELVELAKIRGERDNISVITVKASGVYEGENEV